MKIKKIYLMFMLLSLLSCGSGLTDMFDDMTNKAPVCVDGSVAQSGDGRGWGNAYKTIQEAINAETTEAGAEIWVKQGAYTLTTTLTVGKPVAIYGGFTGSEWTRDGRDLDNKTDIIGGLNSIDITAAGATLDGFEFSGFTSSLMNINEGPVTLNNCEVNGNTNVNAIMFKLNGKSLIVNSCTFSGNTFTGTGDLSIFGAVSGSSLAIADSTFTDNRTSASGAVINANGSTVTIIGGSFDANVTGASGGNGGVIFAVSSTINISGGTTFSNNTSNLSGGVIYSGTGSSALILTNCTFTTNKANDGGAIYLATDAGTLTATGCTFTGSEATNGSGGAISSGRNNPITLSDCDFSDNIAIGTTGSGGAISIKKGNLDSSVLNINSGSRFTNNSAKIGGAIYLSIGNTGDSINIENSTFTKNTALDSGPTVGGGAIFAEMNVSSGTLDVTTCDFGTYAVPANGNSATNGSGGAIFLSGVTLNSNGCNFYENKANSSSGGGGAIFTNCSLIVDDCTISKNTANDGGGVYLEGATASSTISNCIITGNTATENNNWGGGIRASNLSSLSLIDTVLTLNEAQNGGGAYLQNINNLTIRGCSFGEKGKLNGNKATYIGGALFLEESNTVIDRTAFYGNSALELGGAVWLGLSTQIFTIANSLLCSNSVTNTTGLGGGIYVSNGGGINKILNSTFYDNRAKYDAASIFLNGGSFDIYNSVFWNNTSNNGQDISVGSDISSKFLVNKCAGDDDINNGVGGSPSLDFFPSSPFVTTTSTAQDFLYPTDELANKGHLDNSLFSPYNLDLAGNTRPVDDIVDIGCYERQ